MGEREGGEIERQEQIEGDIGKITPTLRRELNSAGSHIATTTENTKHDLKTADTHKQTET